MSRRLNIVGLGPGDPELVTIKGLKAIQNAKLIFAPSNRDSDSVALNIAAPWLDPVRQKIIKLPLVMTKNAGESVTAWQTAADCIAAEMRRIPGEAVYLMLGDPSLYGTSTYITMQLVERHPGMQVEVIPGITSFAATAARAGVSLGLADERILILPASYENDTLPDLLRQFDTVILMKAGSVLPYLLDTLERLDLLANAIYAEKVGMPDERIVHDVRALPRATAPYFSLLIVRKNHEAL